VFRRRICKLGLFLYFPVRGKPEGIRLLKKEGGNQFEGKPKTLKRKTDATGAFPLYTLCYALSYAYVYDGGNWTTEWSSGRQRAGGELETGIGVENGRTDISSACEY
jgi:hypothetical protein